VSKGTIFSLRRENGLGEENRGLRVSPSLTYLDGKGEAFLLEQLERVEGREVRIKGTTGPGQGVPTICWAKLKDGSIITEVPQK